MALYVDSSAHSERVLRLKDARYSHLPVAEFVNLSVPGAMLPNSRATVAGPIPSANICCFWFTFRCKSTGCVAKHKIVEDFGHN